MNLKIKFALILFALVILFGACNSFDTYNGSGVSNAVLKKIDNAVFEVVIKKPFDTPDTREVKIAEGREEELFEDDIVYEKELAWHSVDYQNRVDEYISVGTAFAISDTELLTAAHVLSLESKALWDQLYVRDKQGQVFELDQILKYANNRDYTLFTAKGLSDLKPLDLNPNYELNSHVYAVGNALGEGIIVRDGLLTSTSKEFEEGEWEYLRYSAAASPGNSGGPLLDSRGRVVGIVLKKSENENLNYALPITEVMDAKYGWAINHRFISYHLAITHRKFGPDKHTSHLSLPLHYNELREKLVEIDTNHNEKMIEALNSMYSEYLFPQGEGSYRMLHKAGSYGFPQITAEGEEDGIWGLYQPQEIEDSILSNNGYISFGSIGDFVMMRFRKPLDVSMETLLNDSEYFMDLFLEAYPLNRYFGQQPVRIQSLGAADEEYDFVDKFDRTWLIRSWDVVFADSKIVIYSMPTPSGFISMILVDQVGSIDQVLSKDIQEYMNYLFFSFSGTFAEWEEFVALDLDETTILDQIDFFYTDGGKMSFEASPFKIEYDSEFLTVSEDSVLTLNTTYQFRDGKAVWVPVGIATTDSFVGDNYMAMIREYKPEEVLVAGYHENWEKLINQEHPYTSLATPSDDSTTSNTLVNRFKVMTPEEIDEIGYVYFAGIGMEGTHSDEEIKIKLDLLQEGLTIKE